MMAEAGRALHVAMASPWPPWRPGDGTAKHCHELACALAGLGVRVTVVTIDHPGRPAGLPYAVEIADSGAMARLRRLEGRLPVGGMTARQEHDRRFNRKAAAIARRIGADLVHRQGAGSTPLRTGLPVVLTLHNGTIPADEATPSGVRHRLLFPLGELDRRRRGAGLRRCLAAATHIVCVSDHVAAKVVGRLGVATPSTTVPNGVPRAPPGLPTREEARARLGVAPATRLVLFVGRLSREKRPERLLPLLDAPDCTLAFLGTGPLEARLREAAAHQPRLRVLGFQPEDDKRLWMRAAGALALPSGYFEGNPIVMMEALGLGTPVYGTHAEWLPAELRRFGRFGDDVRLAMDAMAIDATPAADLLPSWDDVARRTLQVYEAARARLGQAGPGR